MSAQYMTLEEFIKQYNLKPVDHKVGVYEDSEEQEEQECDDTPLSSNIRLISENEWDNILG